MFVPSIPSLALKKRYGSVEVRIYYVLGENAREKGPIKAEGVSHLLCSMEV